MSGSSLSNLLHDFGTLPSHLQIGLSVVLKRKATDQGVTHSRAKRATGKDLHKRRLQVQTLKQRRHKNSQIESLTGRASRSQYKHRERHDVRVDGLAL